jgi:hypothetical protein
MKARTFFSVLLVSSIIPLCGQTELTGPVTEEMVLQKCADWQPIMAAYDPKPEFIERLRGLTREVRIEVFLGAWCSDSKAHVSEYFKVLELADTPLIQTSYIAVPEDKAKRAPFYGDKDIMKIPTFIVFVDGLEKGRIIEVPAKSVEEDLVEIIER